MHGPSHRIGRTPHAIIWQEMKDKGFEIDQLSIYIRTRIDPNGVPNDDEASIVIGQMREKLSQIPAIEQTSEIDVLKSRLQSGGFTVVGTPPMTYTQGGNQILDASREDHHNKNLPQNVSFGDLDGFALDEVLFVKIDATSI
ncbi:hypothetical protein ACH5RR_023218 [Cinchona calisaya]|uniref:Uncharacterized protein n=1 Tax=Cinchona calisaya TaxID=153742 RepID=A0ABD2ZA09_9GENT